MELYRRARGAFPFVPWTDAGARPVRALGADAPSSRGAPGGLAVPARGAGPHAPGFWVGLRARDFPTERVLSRTPLIVRTVDQINTALLAVAGVEARR